MGHRLIARGMRHRTLRSPATSSEGPGASGDRRAHADAASVDETECVQIVEWYDELLRFADMQIVRLNRAVAVGEADGARQAGGIGRGRR